MLRQASLLLITTALLPVAPTPRAQLELGAQKIEVEVARTPQSRAQGLMFRNALKENSGMLFVYPKPRPLCMWMRHTALKLTVAFLDADGRILNVRHMTPFDETARCSQGKARYALEMAQGWFAAHGLKAGDRVSGLDELPP